MATVFAVTRSARVSNARQWRRLTTVSVFLLAAGSASLLARARWTNRPHSVACAFLKDCGTGNLENLRSLLDPRHREAFHEKSCEGILADLHRYVPRAYRVLMSGHPNLDGMVSDWRRYHVLIQFEEPDEARQKHKTFAITLIQARHGGWSVDFRSTYYSLFRSLYGASGEQYLRHSYSVLQSRTGGIRSTS